MKYLEKKNGLLPIGIVAKSYGISENCIRRMEAADLLKPAYISRESGYRYYDSANVSRIGTILTLRSFGFVNEDIKEYFESSENYSVLYGKLLKKQQTLNRLIDRMRRLQKNDGIFRYEIAEYDSAYCYTKTIHFTPTISGLSELMREILYDAIQSGLPVNYTRAFLIKSDCTDYREYNVYEDRDYTICLPLREPSEGSGIELIPPIKVVSVAWSYPGLAFRELISFIDEVFKAAGLTQTDTLCATYDLGGNTGGDSSSEETVMHIMVPI